MCYTDPVYTDQMPTIFPIKDIELTVDKSKGCVTPYPFNDRDEQEERAKVLKSMTSKQREWYYKDKRNTEKEWNRIQ